MRRIHLIRHGAVAGDGHRRYLGRTDLAMSEAGIAQIAALAEVFATMAPFDVVWCSDLDRARRTAEILAAARGIPIRVDARLREIDMGDWEGLDRAALRRADPEAHAARGRDLFGFRPPGGESFADVQARLLPVWAEIADEAGDARIAVAGHAGVHRLLLCHILGMPPANLFRLPKTYGHVDVLERTGDGWVARLVDAGPAAVEAWRRGLAAG